MSAHPNSSSTAKRSAIVAGALIAMTTSALYILWFVLLDRRFIFLYEHLGATPFDASTASRYWMTGLVAGGIVLLFYGAANLLLRWRRKEYCAPDWWRVWLWALLPSLPVLLLTVMFWGAPPLPLVLALVVALVFAAALGLAIYAATLLAMEPAAALRAWLDGLAFAPLLILLPLSVEFSLRRSAPAALAIPVFLAFAGVVWMMITGWVYRRFQVPYPPASQVVLAGLVSAWLLLPVLHYAISRPGHIRYISDAGNFFAGGFWLQMAALLASVGIVWLGGWRRGGSV